MFGFGFTFWRTVVDKFFVAAGGGGGGHPTYYILGF